MCYSRLRVWLLDVLNWASAYCNTCHVPGWTVEFRDKGWDSKSRIQKYKQPLFTGRETEMCMWETERRWMKHGNTQHNCSKIKVSLNLNKCFKQTWYSSICPAAITAIQQYLAKHSQLRTCCTKSVLLIPSLTVCTLGNLTTMMH